MFNPVNFVSPAYHGVVDHVPQVLRKEVAHKDITSLQLLQSNHARVKAKMGLIMMFGYNLPDPDVPNCFSIWFTGGTIEVNNLVNNREEWKRIFGGKDIPKQHLIEEARVLAAKILLGAAVPYEMEEDSTMRYQFHRPIREHG
eukprot:14699406-Ditylum_brightwellii.AAC.1